MASLEIEGREDARMTRARIPVRGAVCLIALSLFGLRSAAAVAGDAGMPALVVLVRHAEKAANPKDDPPLTKAGKERARALVEALKDTRVTAIITSDAQRTRETAQPLAEALGLKPVVVGLGRSGAKAHAEAVAAELRRLAGGVVVVVDHSDTIPLIIAALGGPHLPEISSKEYANFFLLSPGTFRSAPGARPLRRSRRRFLRPAERGSETSRCSRMVTSK